MEKMTRYFVKYIYIGFVFQLTAQLEKEVASHKKMEEELRNVAEKRDAITHWEKEIKDIIQMVCDEKDARGFLQALAEKMRDELETLKVSGIAGGAMVCIP